MMNTPQRDFALESLTIRNFRCFNSAHVEFNRLPRQVCINQGTGVTTTVEPLTVFLAKNGMGKTAIIDGNWISSIFAQDRRCETVAEWQTP